MPRACPASFGARFFSDNKRADVLANDARHQFPSPPSPSNHMRGGRVSGFPAPVHEAEDRDFPLTPEADFTKLLRNGVTGLTQRLYTVEHCGSGITQLRNFGVKSIAGVTSDFGPPRVLCLV